MLHELIHPLRLLWNGRVLFFLPVWLSITALAAVLAARIVPAKATTEVVSRREGRSGRGWLNGSTLWILALVLLFGCYVREILVWEDFTYYDNSHFTNETLVGRNVSLQVSPEAGRFWPLGYQEFNALRHITRSVTGYHALHIVELVVICSILLVLDERLSIRGRVWLILLLWITPSIVISFSGLIYPEANEVLWIACLAWSVRRFERTNSPAWSVAAVLSAQCLLYYKETACLFVLGFAGGSIVLRCRNDNEPGWNWKRLRDSESRLDICLVGLAGVFVLYYLAVLFPHFGAKYAKDHKLPLLKVMGIYSEIDLLVVLFVIVCALRAFLMSRGKLEPSRNWDALALGGILYLGGYVALGMESSYYLAPVDLIAVLYIGRLAILSLSGAGLRTRLGALVLLLLVCTQDVALSAFRVYERKNVVHGKALVGEAIKERYEQSPQSVQRLFFPFATPFNMLEFASYLQYIGVPVEQHANGTGSGNGVLLIGKSIQTDGPCGYRTFLCHPGTTPDPGDLVVVLPDDISDVEEINAYRNRSSESVLWYDPWPSISQWERPIVNRLHIESPIFAFRQLPDSWLTASVSVWR